MANLVMRRQFTGVCRHLRTKHEDMSEGEPVFACLSEGPVSFGNQTHESSPPGCGKAPPTEASDVQDCPGAETLDFCDVLKEVS